MEVLIGIGLVNLLALLGVAVKVNRFFVSLEKRFTIIEERCPHVRNHGRAEAPVV